jgi:anti-sigma regulatory factor (Ser/Thr protein kinase)
MSTTAATPTLPDPTLEIPPKEALRRFRRDELAPHAARNFTADFLTAHRINSDTVYTAKLLISETVTNAALYANRGQITVAISVGDKHIRFDITDAGRARADVALDTEFDDESEHGRGWAILAELATEAGIERLGGGNGNRVYFTLDRSGGCAS